MNLNKTGSLAAIFWLTSGLTSQAQEPPQWVEKSNEYAQVPLKAIAGFSPEFAGSVGLEGYDEKIGDLRPRLHERTMKASKDVLDFLTDALKKEKDPHVRQDLEILVKSTSDSMRSAELQREHMIPYFNVAQTVFRGIRALLDPQVAQERYPAAVLRLRKYAGVEPGFEPLPRLAKARSMERMKVKGLLGPYRGEVEQDLERADTFLDGLPGLFEEAGLEGWRPAYDALVTEMRDYADWVRAEILPRARDDFRLPPAMYRDALRNWGVDADPNDLIRIATQGYMDIRNEMVALAPLVAAQKGYDTKDYREVISLLKEERIDGDKLLDYYKDVLSRLETIIRREELVSLPDRDAGIRIASAAETAAQPAAHLETPRMIGNTGEFPSFVLPLLGKNEDGTWMQSDASYEAGTWTLTAHEARPGHELQFSSMIETGVSITRALFAFNSANVEGWALYAEAIAKPFLPLDAQMISLQYRLARAARMFLDPMLNLGQITPEDAKRLLTEDVVLGESWAQNEIERYTYRIPGQATAYYFGYINLQSLRTRTELALRERFVPRDFHDFVLAQGLLPPELLEKAVMERFVPAQRAPRSANAR